MAFSLLHQQSQSQRQRQRQKQGKQMLIESSSTMDYIGIQRLFNHEQVPTGGLDILQNFGSNASSYPSVVAVPPLPNAAAKSGSSNRPRKQRRIKDSSVPGHLHHPFLGMAGHGGCVDLNRMFPTLGGRGLLPADRDRHGGSSGAAAATNDWPIDNNKVSTGLRLAFDPEEPSSSITSSRPDSSAASMATITLPDDLLSAHLSRHRDELDHLLRSQSEQLCRALGDSARRHTEAVLAAVDRRVRDAGAELARAGRRATELEEVVGRLEAECRAWQSKARSSEALVSVLRTELHRTMAMAQKSRELHSQAMMEEGCGESTAHPEPEPEPLPVPEPDRDAASAYTAGENCRPPAPRPRMMRRPCKGCESNHEASVVLLPCLHLCLCTSCKDGFRLCPVCNSSKTGAVEVYLD